MFALSIAACIIIGYLIGAIPTSYLVGKYWGKLNLLDQGKSHVSGTAIYRELGLVPFIVVIAVDVLKGILAIYICQVLNGNIWTVMATALAAAIGHCWSVYIKYYGGLGATIIFGMLFYTGIMFSNTHIPWEFALGGVAALITILTVKKSTLGTILWLVIISAALFIELLAFRKGTLAMALLPLILLGVQLTKQRVSRRQGDVYENNLASDLKRVNRIGPK
jgi:glycerol-3-phosphate acyltransferase PlsY